MKYRRHDIHGILPIDKPLGITSMDVVRRVRRAAGHAKTGHAGTLDPLATGLLLVCLGRATKSVAALMDAIKTYEAAIDLSALSNTDDAEGELAPVEVAAPPSEQDVRTALDALTGTIEQTPPAYSAIKVDGQRAYKLARQGEDVKLEPRPVRIDRIDLDEYTWPRLRITITCGKGTYIRSLARQIGEALGTGGYLTALRRTAIGPYALDHPLARTIDDLPEPIEPRHLIAVPGAGVAG